MKWQRIRNRERKKLARVEQEIIEGKKVAAQLLRDSTDNRNIAPRSKSDAEYEDRR